MDQAGAAFDRLGFPLTPLTVHRNEDEAGNRIPTGTANRCAMLGRGYLEILTDVEGLDTPFSRAHRAAVARYEGLHLIAFSVDDVGAEAGRLDAGGFEPHPVANLRRPMPVDGGGDEVAGFSVLRVAPGTMAEGRMQILRHETPDVVWQPSMIPRHNGVSGLSGVVICTDDPSEAADRYARFTGRGLDGAGVALDRGRLDFVDPAGLSRIVPAARPPRPALHRRGGSRKAPISRRRGGSLRRPVFLSRLCRTARLRSRLNLRWERGWRYIRQGSTGPAASGENGTYAARP